MRARRHGLSVIEVMVSLVILATGILITMAAISFGLKATTTSAQSTEATAYARRLLEIVLTGGTRGPVLGGDVLNSAYDGVVRSLYGATGPPAPFVVEDFIRSTDPKDLKRFSENASSYNVSVSLARLNTTNVDAFDYALINVTVTLAWSDKLGPRSLKTSGIYRR